MSKILGTNALVYIGSSEAPQRNAWSLNVARELKEARVFQGSTAAESWVSQLGGFKSWSGSLGGYYDNANETIVELGVGTGFDKILLYENRGDLTRYWYGVAWVEVSEDSPADDFIELNIDFTGDGPLLRFN